MSETNAYSGRHASVSGLSVIGPRQVNQDRASAVISDDGSWVIAVADGLGGHVRGDEAAQAAIEGLPQRIGTAEEMAVAFGEANERVLALTDAEKWRQDHWQILDLSEFPMSTLCLSSWTPEGGLLIGWMGDTLPFVVSATPEGFSGFLCGRPHRVTGGKVEICLGMPPVGAFADPGVVEVEIIGESGDGIVPDAVVLASDGAWEPFVDQHGVDWLVDRSADGGIGAACSSDSSGTSDGSEGSGTETAEQITAKQIAENILAKATELGLNDNASVAVALWH